MQGICPVFREISKLQEVADKYVRMFIMFDLVPEMCPVELATLIVSHRLDHGLSYFASSSSDTLAGQQRTLNGYILLQGGL